MQHNTQEVEDQKKQLITGLSDAAAHLRSAANYAEGFANLLKHTQFAPIGEMRTFMLAGMYGDMNQQHAPLEPATTAARGKKARASPAEDEDDGKKKRKKAERKPKDPNAPKRPPSAYLLFQNAVRKDMQAKFPGRPYHDVLQEISLRWKAMPDDEKEVYQQATSEAKAKYLDNKAAYDMQGSNGAAAPEPPAAVVAPAAPAVPKVAAKLVPVVASTSDDESSEEESDSSEEDEDEDEEDTRPAAKKSKAHNEPPPAPASTSKPAPAAKAKEQLQVKERKKKAKA